MPTNARVSTPSPAAVFALAVLASTAWTPVTRASEFPAIIPLSSLDGTNGFRLDGAAGDDSGYSVASAGDVNGDGFSDVVIGALRASPGGRTEAGSNFVVFGKASGFSAAIDLSSLDGTNGFRLKPRRQPVGNGGMPGPSPCRPRRISTL